MLNIDLRKIYRFTPVEPPPSPAELPRGAEFYYECLDCTGIVNSVPHVKSACTCGNLAGAGGDLDVKDPGRVKVVTGRLK